MSRKFNGDSLSKQGLLQVFSRAKCFTGTNKTGQSSLPPNLVRYFSLEEIKLATNNFNDDNFIGRGDAGSVYKGSIIDNGLTPVAIKRLSSKRQEIHRFKTEVLMMSQLRHRNLVPLIGYSDDGKEMIAVYDFMARGSLEYHLHRHDDHHNPPLSWKQRLEVCVGAARGICYLHTGVKHTIIHRNVKTSNILLNDGWMAKVCDLSLSKVGPNTIMSSSNSRPCLERVMSNNIKGTYGYIDPEYSKSYELTEKSDVYSFGVVLLEVLSAQSPIIIGEDGSRGHISEWVYGWLCEDKLDEVIDPYLKGTIAHNSLMEFLDIAVRCLSLNGTERPHMSEVASSLELALELQDRSSNQDMVNGGEEVDAITDREELVELVRSRYRESILLYSPIFPV